MLKLRAVIQSHRFEQEMAAIEARVERSDQFLEGAEWYLVRCPEVEMQLGNSHVWFLPTEELVAMEPLMIYYTFNDDRVVLLSIEKAKAGLAE